MGGKKCSNKSRCGKGVGIVLGADQIRKLKTKDKKYLLNDGNGLYLIVHPNGSKYWILRYSEDGRKTSVSLGSYPEFSQTS